MAEWFTMIHKGQLGFMPGHGWALVTLCQVKHPDTSGHIGNDSTHGKYLG